MQGSVRGACIYHGHELRRGAEEPGETERRVRGDASVAVDDLVHPRKRHVNPLRQLGLSDSERPEELLQEHFSWEKIAATLEEFYEAVKEQEPGG